MSNKKAYGLDPGTVFFQVAEQKKDGEIDIKTVRNAFVEIPESEDIEQILQQNNWQYIVDKNHYYIIGDDSIKIARMFPGKIEIRRPMQDGVLNKNEDKKMLIMASLIENLIGKAEFEDSVVCYCVSSPSIDTKSDNVFHKNRLDGMIKRLGYKTKCIDEAMGILLSERPSIKNEENIKIPYSGITCSFGGGRVNCVLAYRGLQIMGMSTSRCLSKDFLVLTDNGCKKIQDIVIGDKVIDISGSFVFVKEVINNGKRDYLINLELNNLPFISHKMTEDHNICIKKDNQWIWIEAKDIVEGNILGEPVVKYDGKGRSFYYGFDRKNKKALRGHRSRNLGRIIGLFLGDGSVCLYKNGQGCNGGYIQWVFNAKDEKLVKEYMEIISSYFNHHVSLNSIDNIIVMKIHSVSIAKNFKEKFYDKNKQKVCSIPLNMIPNQMAIGIVQGLIDSDGNLNNQNGFDFNNTSLNLAILFHQILGRFGIKHSFMVREPRIGGINSKGIQIIGKKDCYVIKICGFPSNLLRLLFNIEGSGVTMQIYDIIEHKVKKIFKEEYFDDVYDLSVDSNHHSFAGVGCLVHNCGDWIDEKVAEQTGIPLSQVTYIKEHKLDFNNIDYEDDLLFALDVYYTNVIEYTFKNFCKKFKTVKSQFEAPLDIILAGGTSMPFGFQNKIESIIRTIDLPFKIKSIKVSKDPCNSVVKGLLIQAIISQKKLIKDDIEKDLE